MLKILCGPIKGDFVLCSNLWWKLAGAWCEELGCLEVNTLVVKQQGGWTWRAFLLLWNIYNDNLVKHNGVFLKLIYFLAKWQFPITQNANTYSWNTRDNPIHVCLGKKNLVKISRWFCFNNICPASNKTVSGANKYINKQIFFKAHGVSYHFQISQLAWCYWKS